MFFHLLASLARLPLFRSDPKNIHNLYIHIGSSTFWKAKVCACLSLVWRTLDLCVVLVFGIYSFVNFPHNSGSFFHRTATTAPSQRASHPASQPSPATICLSVGQVESWRRWIKPKPVWRDACLYFLYSFFFFWFCFCFICFGFGSSFGSDSDFAYL